MSWNPTHLVWSNYNPLCISIDVAHSHLQAKRDIVFCKRNAAPLLPR